MFHRGNDRLHAQGSSMFGRVNDATVAQAIAAEVRRAAEAEQRRSWRKVTTLLSAFEVYRLTQASRQRIGQALTDAGLVLDPPFDVVARAGTVHLTIADDLGSRDARAHPFPVSDLARWIVDSGRLARLPATRSTEATFLIDVNLSETETDGLPQRLKDQLPGLDDKTLEDLLTADTQAAFKMQTREVLRRASVYQVTSTDTPVEADSRFISFSVALVELAVGPGWVLTVRHPPEGYVNGTWSVEAVQAHSTETFIEDLGAHGVPAGATPDALAGLVLRHALSSFGMMREELASWLETWRLEDAEGQQADGGLLLDLQQVIPVLSERLRPLRHPSATAWLKAGHPGTAEEIKELVEREIESLSSLGQSAAADLASVKQRKTERYHRSLTTLAAVFLAPSLVAAIFGASDQLSDSWTDLFVMLLTQVVTAASSFVGIRRYLDRDSQRR